MLVTDRTKEYLRCRRIRRKLLAEGFEEVSEGGGNLWELHRGYRTDRILTDAVIAPEGKSVFVKTRKVLHERQ
jgi:hypothetical protein